MSSTLVPPKPATEPIVSVAGLRGVVGESLTPEIVVRYVAAFSRMLPNGRVAVGGDSRASREWITPLVEATLRAAGKQVVHAGLLPTPTMGILVRKLRAVGGIAITASHNPAPYNGLKFFSRVGEFLNPAQFEEFKTYLDAQGGIGAKHLPPTWLTSKEVFETHLAVLRHTLTPVRGRKLPIVIDCCNGAGSEIAGIVAREYGGNPTLLFADSAKEFPREAEPLPEHLRALCIAVKKNKAVAGFALDPDADRLALVDERGMPLGEERTLLLAADAWMTMTRKRGPIVANLSSSRVLDDLAARHKVELFRTKVGEAHVIEGLRRHKAVIGGEGNGGVILPPVHPGRDAMAGIALILLGLRARGGTLSDWNNSFPKYEMVKDKAPRGGLDMAAVSARIRAAWPGAAFDATDGIKMILDDRWLHVRPSGTEPIVRLFAEAPDAVSAKALVARAREALATKA